MIVNRKALFNYNVIEKFEAGIVLLGFEVKAIRLNGAIIANAYITYKHPHVYILNMSITDYKNRYNANKSINTLRERILLLKQKEIKKIKNSIAIKGKTVVPLSLYFNKKGFVKLECAIVEGKNTQDKRETIKKRDLERQAK